MYILDTNFVSELRKGPDVPSAKPAVAWASQADEDSLYLSAITILELERGVRRIERKDGPQGALLRRWLDEMVRPAFAGRILPVDEAVALRCAALHVPNPVPYRDGLIAATALVHSMAVVTGNVKDFERTGVTIIDPWEVERP
ncbi:type II toxin-antitoxin system VapC family toxin [Erythrobacter sp. MTPC3]|uniref:type II toxin-antitoxin system VapC family toxin n=1 Tax=Erythrobacter sp. MTPC3 TaxID=3056564 RepID=UPI0036F3CFA3